MFIETDNEKVEESSCKREVEDELGAGDDKEEGYYPVMEEDCEHVSKLLGGGGAAIRKPKLCLHELRNNVHNHAAKQPYNSQRPPNGSVASNSAPRENEVERELLAGDHSREEDQQSCRQVVDALQQGDVQECAERLERLGGATTEAATARGVCHRWLRSRGCG